MRLDLETLRPLDLTNPYVIGISNKNGFLIHEHHGFMGSQTYIKQGKYSFYKIKELFENNLGVIMELEGGIRSLCSSKEMRWVRNKYEVKVGGYERWRLDPVNGVRDRPSVIGTTDDVFDGMYDTKWHIGRDGAFHDIDDTYCVRREKKVEKKLPERFHFRKRVSIFVVRLMERIKNSLSI